MLKYMHGISKNDHLKLVTLGLGAVMLVTACGGGSSSTTSTTQSGTFTHVAGSRSQNQIPFSTTIGGVGLPGARISPMGVADNGGASGPSGANLWVFGGRGFDANGIIGGNTSGYFNDLWRYNQSTGQWMLESGSTLISQLGVFPASASQGTTLPGLTPGSRSGGVAFTDAQNNIWIFGGIGCDSTTCNGSTGNALNDLWKFSPNSASNGGTWAWVSGSKTNKQNSTYASVQGTPGSGNVPGARFNPASVQDSAGNFYIFGGIGCDRTGASACATALGDLWKFNPTTGLWTWLGGTQTGNTPGTYGTQGTAANTNFPGARSGSTMYLDSSNNIWIFGGIGCDGATCSTSANYLNDVWMFNPAQQTWTWVNGSNRANVLPNGTLISQGVPGSIPVTPTPRTQASRFTDPSGNFWIFGGQGFDINGLGGSATPAYLNDAWKYTPSTNQWTYVNGSLFANQFANYGTMGVAAFSNIPGARYATAGFGDGAGNFWMYGGQGFASNSSGSSVGFLSDLWKMTP